MKSDEVLPVGLLLDTEPLEAYIQSCPELLERKLKTPPKGLKPMEIEKWNTYELTVVEIHCSGYLGEDGFWYEKAYGTLVFSLQWKDLVRKKKSIKVCLKGTASFAVNEKRQFLLGTIVLDT